MVELGADPVSLTQGLLLPLFPIRRNKTLSLWLCVALGPLSQGLRAVLPEGCVCVCWEGCG